MKIRQNNINIQWIENLQKEKIKEEVKTIFEEINKNYLKLMELIFIERENIKNFNNKKCLEVFKITKNKCQNLIKLKKIFQKFKNIYFYIYSNNVALNISEMLLDLNDEELKRLDTEVKNINYNLDIKDFTEKIKKINNEVKYKNINIKLNDEEYKLFQEIKEMIQKIIKEKKVTNKQTLFYLIYEFISSNSSN